MSRGRGIPCPTVCLLNLEEEEEERRLQGMNYRLEGEEEEEDSGEAVIMMYRMGEEEEEVQCW